MAKQSIGLGTTANDGTGDNLRVGGDKVNDNFDEIYTALGDRSALQITTAGASSNQVLQWSTTNSRFEPTASAAAGDISVDTTPQLGGNLDVNGHDIVSTSSGDINIIPQGTGRLKFGSLRFPSSAGTSTYVLATDGAADMYWKQVGSVINLSADAGANDAYTVGDVLNFAGGTGLTSTVLDDTIRFDIDSNVVTLADTQTLSNKTLDNVALTGTTSGNVQLRCQTIGSYIAQGGNALAGFESATTYAGAFAVDTTSYKSYYAANGTWNEILSSTSSIDILNDVDTTTQAPTSGQALIWNAGSSNWRPQSISTSVVTDTAPSLGGNLDTSGFTIQGTGKISLSGSGSIVKSDFTNTASFPNGSASAGAFAVATSTIKAYYATASGWINLLSENDSIDLLSDVDTSSSAPAYGQVLVWTNVGGTGQWKPNDYTPATRVSAQFTVTASGSTDYVFNGDGFPSAQNDPTLYLKKAHTYQFVISASSHPFEIRTASGGSAYGFGVTNNATGSGTITFTVPMNAPSTLYYQCTSHSGMGGVINIA
jgi:hypothetical protein